MRPRKDLFGQTPVTWPEVRAWCRRVAGIDADDARGRFYVQQWDVPGKIAAAKERGEWSDSLAQHARSHSHKEGPR